MPDTTDGNLSQDPSTSVETKPQRGGDIFQALIDNTVAAARSGNDQPKTTPSAGTQGGQEGTRPAGPNDYETRWKASSEEGIRLHKENEVIKAELDESKKLLTQYTPYINALNDPKFLDHVDGFFKSPSGQTAPAQQDSGLNPSDFGLEEDDVFSLKDLVNPNKPAGKFFQTLVGKVADQTVGTRLSQFEQRQNEQLQANSRSQALAVQVQQFLGKHPEMTEQQVYSMIEQAKKTPTTLEDVYLVVNKEAVLKNLVAQRKDPGIQNQLSVVRNIPQSMASANSTTGADTLTPEAKIMAVLKRKDNINNLFANLPKAGGI